jgi:hypothetical protein
MHIPHELHDEFPGEALFIERLIKSNHEFGQLATHYDEVNRQIYFRSGKFGANLHLSRS